MFLDMGFGLLLAVMWHVYLGMPLNLRLVGAAVGFALLPDVDFLVVLFVHGYGVGAEHRDLLHYPMIFVLFMILVFLRFGKPWGALFATCTLFHFIHDSVGIGFGIQWVWPFSERYHKFFARSEDAWWTLGQFHVSWSVEDHGRLVRLYENFDWIRAFYLTPHWIGITEIFGLVAGVALFIAHAFSRNHKSGLCLLKPITS